MIPLLRVDLRADIPSAEEYQSRSLWSEDNPKRPPNQAGRRLMLDLAAQMVLVDDVDLIPVSQCIRFKVSKPVPVLQPEPEPFAVEPVTAVAKRGPRKVAK